MADLPVADAQLIRSSRQEYEALVREGSSKSSEACFRLVWALVHSTEPRDVEQGLQLAGALISSEEEDAKMKNELIYLCCVGKYRLGKYLEAKSQVKELLKITPNSRQAEALKEMIDDKLVRDGLIGVGVGAGVLGVVGAVLIGILASRK